MSGQITTYVLNLDRSVDRWQAISDRLSALNIPFVRVPAVDGRTLRLADHVDDAACRRYMGRSMHQGELGCTLGHRLALQRFLASQDAFAVVLEDDALPLPGLEALAGVVAFLHTAPAVSALNLGPSDYKYTSPIHTTGASTILCAHRFAMMANAVLWTRAGAARVLADQAKISLPWDTYLREVFTGDNTGLSLRPPAYGTTGSPSDIEAAANGERSQQRRSPWYFLVKQRRIWRIKLRAMAALIRWRMVRAAGAVRP